MQSGRRHSRRQISVSILPPAPKLLQSGCMLQLLIGCQQTGQTDGQTYRHRTGPLHRRLAHTMQLAAPIRRNDDSARTTSDSEECVGGP